MLAAVRYGRSLRQLGADGRRYVEGDGLGDAVQALVLQGDNKRHGTSRFIMSCSFVITSWMRVNGHGLGDAVQAVILQGYGWEPTNYK